MKSDGAAGVSGLKHPSPPSGSSVEAGWRPGSGDPQYGVSVIIPAYNYARFLPEAIDSVLRQDYAPVEIIVVDDGSTDNTREVAAGYGNLVRYIYQENAGLSVARNTGVRAARHALVAFLDADDAFLPGMLSRLVGVLRDCGPDYVLAACGCAKTTLDGQPTEKKRLTPERSAEVSTRDILMRNRFVADAVVARREAVERAGYFDPSLRSSEDRDLWIRMSRLGRMHVIPDRLVKVRVHRGSMSSDAVRMHENMSRVLAKARQDSEGREGFTVWRRAGAFLHYQTAWMHRDAGDYGAALRHLLMSLAIWPVFLNPHSLNENHFFRLRSLRQFLWEWLWASKR